MADITALKNRIRAAIKANDKQEITGPVLQQTLLDIVDELDLYSELENEVNTRQQADATNKQAIADNKAAIADNKAAIANNKQAIADDKAAIADNKQAISQIQTDLFNDENDIEDNRQAIADNKKAISQTKTELANDEAHIADNTQAIADNKKAIADNKQAITDLSANINIFNEQAGHYEQDIADNKQAIADNKKAIADNKQAITDLSANIDIFNEQAGHYEQDIADNKQAILQTNNNLGSQKLKEFSASTAYKKGDQVKYQGGLYEFIEDTPAGAFDSTKVKAITYFDIFGGNAGDAGNAGIVDNKQVAENKQAIEDNKQAIADNKQAILQTNNLITGIKNNIDNGYVYAGIATPSTVPVSGKVFYMAMQAGTYTNFGGTAVTGGITILKYNGASWVKEQALITDASNAGADVSLIQNSIAGIHPLEGSPTISGGFCFLSSVYALETPKKTIKYSIIDYTNLGLSKVSCIITKINNTTDYAGNLKLTDTIVSSDDVAIKSIRFYIDKPGFTPSGTILIFTSDVNETLVSFIRKNDEKYSNYNNVVLTQERVIEAFGIRITVPTVDNNFVWLTPVLQIQGAPTSLKLVSETHINRNIKSLNVIINGSIYTSVPSNNIITKPEGISTLRFYADKDGEYTDISGYFAFVLLNNGSLIDDLVPKPLFMKKIAFVGDSLTDATSDNHLGWAGRAGNILEMDWSNLGRGGYTTETGDADKSIIKTITNIDKSEYVIVQPSTVNHQAGYTVGKITTSGTDFDTTTYYGALEYIAHYCLTHFNKVAFIIPYRVGESYDLYFNTTLPQAIIDVGFKWGIPVLDLRAMAGFNLVDPDIRRIYGVANTSVALYNESGGYVLDQKTRYNGRIYKAKQPISAPAGTFDSSLWTDIGTEYDNCHCNTDGYKLITNKVVEFVKCL